MRCCVFAVLSFCPFLVQSDAGPATASAQISVDQNKTTYKQIPDFKKKPDDSWQKESAFLKEVEERAKKEGHYAKVEAKGVLHYKQRIPSGGSQYQQPEWYLHSGGMQGITFALGFDEKSDLAKLAKQLDGKTVLVTG